MSAPFPRSARTESTALRSAGPSVLGPPTSELIAASIRVPSAAVAAPAADASPSSTNSAGLVLRPPRFNVTAQNPEDVAGLVHSGESGSGSSTGSGISLSCSRTRLFHLRCSLTNCKNKEGAKEHQRRFSLRNCKFRVDKNGPSEVWVTYLPTTEPRTPEVK